MLFLILIVFRSIVGLGRQYPELHPHSIPQFLWTGQRACRTTQIDVNCSVSLLPLSTEVNVVVLYPQGIP